MFESLSFVFHSKLLHSGREEKAMARGTGHTNTRSESEHQMIPYSLIIWYSFQIWSESDPFVWKSSQGNPRFSGSSLSSHCDHPPGWFQKITLSKISSQLGGLTLEARLVQSLASSLPDLPNLVHLDLGSASCRSRSLTWWWWRWSTLILDWQVVMMVMI